ncbi:glycosyltransferase family 4 protein [Plantactinospora sp. GCM10030261]|uniref:glycosyltransferase family 4 protein n=1 Tax=Plantactinospora sp. GCM10030261 TaxID=3273420 RepID=UPI003608F8B3
MNPARAVAVVLPGDIDDPGAPSGGNRYDRKVCQGLAEAGWSVREHGVAGDWPRPDDTGAKALADTLAALPDGERVLVDGLVACGVPEIVAPQARRLRLAVLVHLPLAEETGLAPDLAAELAAREGATLRAASAVVATSGWAGRRLIELHGLPVDRVRVAAPGVDPAQSAPGTDGTSGLLCVAAVIPRKGHDVLMEALAAVADQSWTCVCAGGLDRAPEHTAGVRGRIEAAGLDERVRLAGPLAGAELDAAYAAADLLILPSRAEPYGMVLTEALARGIPVLATAVDGVPEAVGRAPDGAVPGMFVPPDDPAALAAALRRWFTEPDLRHRVRTAAAHRRAALAGWSATVRVLSEVLEDLR